MFELRVLTKEDTLQYTAYKQKRETVSMSLKSMRVLAIRSIVPLVRPNLRLWHIGMFDADTLNCHWLRVTIN
jgi:hypothetical protein